jgi:vitamin B12/bleomycin/antimicrobial peptide transport system ATP-binding/permease protein
MLWAAIIYAIGGSLLTNKVGHPLVSINYQMQRVEADFRFGLIRLRENAEQIAFYDGMRAEASTAQDLFGRIRDNWWRVMKYTRRYSFVLNAYAQIADIFPIAVASPRYFAGVFSFGTLMQIADAFGSVSDSLSWFINNYDTLVQWRATVNRLREFKRVMQLPHLKESVLPATEHGGINLHYVDESQLATRKLALARARAVRLRQTHAAARAGGSLAVRKRLDRRAGERAHDVHPAAELSAGWHLEGRACLPRRKRRLQRRSLLRGLAPVLACRLC